MSIPFTCPHCGRVTNVADQYAGQSGPCVGCGHTVTIPHAGSPLMDASGIPLAKPAAQPQPTTSSNAWIFVAIALGVLCLCGGGTLVGLLVPAVSSAREAARRMQCQNNLKQLALALHNYHDTYKCFPAAYVADKNGKPLHSWRVALLPYLERSDLYNLYNFDEPWDSPGNLAVAQQMPEYFRCPSDPSGPGGTQSSYVIVRCDPSQQPLQTLFAPNHWTEFREIADGTANTIMVVETSNPVPWTQPDADPDLGQFFAEFAALSSGGQSNHPHGVNVAFADGSVRFLSRELDAQELRALFGPSDGQIVNINW